MSNIQIYQLSPRVALQASDMFGSDDNTSEHKTWRISLQQLQDWMQTHLIIPAAYGEMYFTGNSSSATTFSGANTPTQINAPAFNSGTLENFTQSGGVLTYIGTDPITVTAIAHLTATYDGSSQDTNFYIALDGAVIAKSKQGTFIGAASPAPQANPVKCFVDLVTGSQLSIFAENTVNTNSLFVQDCNFTVTPITSITGTPAVSPDLKQVYDNGINGEIPLTANKPFMVLNAIGDVTANGVTTPSTGTNTVSNYRVLGWTFTPSINMVITALQYDDALFTSSETRETGIYVKGTSALLGSVVIAQSDPLDSTNTYRTKTLDTPIELTAGTQYVYATVVPSGQSDHSNADAVPDSHITITQRAELPSDASPIPLSFPESFTTISNFVHVGSFEYLATVVVDSFQVNDTDTSGSTFMEAKSEDRGVIPVPKMTIAQRNAIVSPDTGLTVIITDSDIPRYSPFDGLAWQEEAYLSDLTQMYASQSSGFGSTVTTISASNTYYPITVALFNDINSASFVNEVVSISGANTPTFRYTATPTKFFEVNFNIFALGTVGTGQYYVFSVCIYKADTSIVVTNISGWCRLTDTSTPFSVPLSGNVQLSTGDRIFVQVKNITSGTNVSASGHNASIKIS